MLPWVLALVLFAAVLLLFALFAKGGPRETRSPGGISAGWSASELQRQARALLERSGYEVELEDERPNGRADWVARDPRPISGGVVYAAFFPNTEAVTAVEVQAAHDRMRGGGFNKALIFAPAGFTHEARAIASDAPIELIDGPRLEELTRAPERMPPEAPAGTPA